MSPEEKIEMLRAALKPFAVHDVRELNWTWEQIQAANRAYELSGQQEQGDEISEAYTQSSRQVAQEHELEQNQCWTIDDKGIFRAKMSEATVGGGKTIYGPYGEPVPNEALIPFFSEATDGFKGIVSWRAVTECFGKMFRLEIENA